jgi:glycosyltransferase involved in cell wall biosynthesis
MHAQRIGRSPAQRRVLIMVENWPVPPDRRTWDESRALAAAGYGVSVICPQAPGQPRYEEHHGVCFHRYPPPRESHGQLSYVYEYAYSLIRAAGLTVKVAARPGFDVIQAINPPDIYFALAVPFKLLGKRFVFEVQDLAPELYMDRFARPRRLVLLALRILERASLMAADHVITPNPSFSELALARGARRPRSVTAVYHGPDTNRLSRRAARPELKEGKPFLACFLGMIDPQSRIDLAVRAAHHLVHEIKRHDCHFAFLGDGTALPDVRRLAHELQLDDWVTFTGWADDDMVLDYLSTADVGLHPDPKEEREDISTTEKSLEYMALGLPFVAFDLKEVRSTAGESALYAEGNDVVTYARLLGELLDDPERRAAMAQEGRRRIEESLSWDRQQVAYLRLYDDLLGGRSQAPAAALPTGTGLAYGRPEE